VCVRARVCLVGVSICLCSYFVHISLPLSASILPLPLLPFTPYIYPLLPSVPPFLPSAPALSFFLPSFPSLSPSCDVLACVHTCVPTSLRVCAYMFATCDIVMIKRKQNSARSRRVPLVLLFKQKRKKTVHI